MVKYHTSPQLHMWNSISFTSVAFHCYPVAKRKKNWEGGRHNERLMGRSHSIQLLCTWMQQATCVINLPLRITIDQQWEGEIAQSVGYIGLFLHGEIIFKGTAAWFHSLPAYGIFPLNYGIQGTKFNLTKLSETGRVIKKISVPHLTTLLAKMVLINQIPRRLSWRSIAPYY